MQYLYLNNIRGFRNTYVPILECNFLVGENSTGKSSLLGILRSALRYDFLFQPRITLGEDDAPATFSDLVSAWSEDKTYFDIGVLSVEGSKEKSPNISYSIQRFSDINGQAQPVQAIHRHDKRRIHIKFQKKYTEYVAENDLRIPSSEQAMLSEFKHAVGALETQNGSFSKLPKEFPAYPPVALALSIVNSMESGKGASNQKEFKVDLPISRRMAWIAPIRTKPKRIYHGASKGYSSEGEHTPFVIKQRLKSKAFVETLKSFGAASGLFEVVTTHTFGKGKQNPFEILIRLNGASFNIENVGYGVSQALPLVVEFLAAGDARTFAIQQPEVHLHPKAQAALGSLIFQLASERSHRFIVETHSDFLIDRYRLELKKRRSKPKSQVLFFHRSSKGNGLTSLPIGDDGRYPPEQPPGFRGFFIHEESQLLSL